MKQEKRIILVHCAAGVSRSASFVIAYLMKDEKMPFHQAIDKVKAARKWANPNTGFRKQLIEYNSELGHPAPPPEYIPQY